MIEWLASSNTDQVAAILGLLVGLWGVGSSLWRLADTSRRETLALAAVSAGLALLARDRRRDRGESPS